MEENQVPNPNPDQFNFAGTGKKKKGIGPFGGFCLALLIVFLICVIGLLVRMVIAGDGDYFRPIKLMCGMEVEDDEDDETPKKSSKSSTETDVTKSPVKTPVISSGRYTLLSDDVEDKNVKHYRLTIDMGEFFSKLMKELNNSSTSNSMYSYNSDIDIDMGGLEDMMGMAMLMLSQMADVIDGEMYIDVYFEGNDIVQVIIGYDYAEFLEKFYDYMADLDEDSLEDEGIESADDLAKKVVEALDEYLDKDTIYEMLTEDEEVESKLKSMGFKEKDVKDAIDFVNEEGLFEFYINGTTKLKGLISMMLDSDEFEDSLKDMEKELGTKIDRNNIIESVLEAVGETAEYGDFGFEFVEVK